MMTAGAAAAAAFVLSASIMPSATTAFVAVAPASRATVYSRSSSSSSARYMSHTLEVVSDFYQNFPVQSAVLTCGLKASVADTIAQVTPQIEENMLQEQEEQTRISSNSNSNNNNNSIDWEVRRNLAYVLYGGIFVGLMSHLEYSCVFPFIFGYEKTLQITIEKVFFDNLVSAPLMWLPPAYFIKEWVYGAGGDDNNNDNDNNIFKQGLDKYLTDIRDNQLLIKYWTIWFPAQSISFSVVPDHLRVAFMASISFFWFILFSSVASKGDIKQGQQQE